MMFAFSKSLIVSPINSPSGSNPPVESPSSVRHILTPSSLLVNDSIFIPVESPEQLVLSRNVQHLSWDDLIHQGANKLIAVAFVIMTIYEVYVLLYSSRK